MRLQLKTLKLSQLTMCENNTDEAQGIIDSIIYNLTKVREFEESSSPSERRVQLYKLGVYLEQILEDKVRETYGPLKVKP